MKRFDYRIPVHDVPLLLAVILAVVAACGTPAAKSALEVIAPIAADALSDLISDRFGSDTDEGTAGCFELPEGFNDDGEGYVYIICRAKPVGGDDE